VTNPAQYLTPRTVHLPGDGPDPNGSYQVPSGTAEQAALASLRPVQEPPPQPTATDRIQQDAETPDALPDWPENAPELKPLMRLPFGARAVAMDLFTEVQSLANALEAAQKISTEVTPAQAAAMYRTYDKLDQLMLSVAVNRDAYEAWEGRWDDALFGQLWAAYQARMNPGEASRSSS